ncbi:MAG TPA: hypothetical protein DCZ11_08920 [Gammaproteobacteria bacterium]|nr:hypothetical protein [Gammaproteobacteria bacterium]MCH78551.1 hypothetical protein [Gammaproteobacteria bacterium]
MSSGQTLDLYDGRQLALLIARAYPCGYLELGSIGVTWVPRDPRGRHWTPRRCAAVLGQLVAFGLCSLHEGWAGALVRVTEQGYRALDMHGALAIRDADAERILGPALDLSIIA